MEWYVYYHSINQQKIVKRNLFNHGGYVEDFKKIRRKSKTKEEFSEKLKSEVKYHFWSRAEWELIIEITEDNRIFLKPWCGCREPDKIKIDVTDETDFDWRGFAEKHIKQQIYKNSAKIDVFDQLDYVWDDFTAYCWETSNRTVKKILDETNHAQKNNQRKRMQTTWNGMYGMTAITPEKSRR